MIIIVGAVCERCRIPDDGQNMDHFLNRTDGDHFHSICKNVFLCQERQASDRRT